MIPDRIKLAAIRGGWPQDLDEMDDTSRLILSPLFWQALGKALGWDDEWDGHGRWYWNAHRFYDLILTGGDTEKFWNDLLPTPKDPTP